MTKAALGGSADRTERTADHTEPVAMPQPETLEITLRTGRRVVMRELNGGEQIRIDEMCPIDKVVGLASLRPIACIREIEGHKLPFPQSYKELMATAQRLLAREMAEVQYHYRKTFDFDIPDDLSKD